MRRITYFAPFLKSLAMYKPIWDQIESVLEKEGELYDFVPNANDIWVRDFMPFQRHDGEFLIYRYKPDYLSEKNERYITNCRDAFLAAGGSDVLSSNICKHTNLILDGGNMIKCVDKNGVDCVIMTTKVLYENKGLSHHEILLELEDYLDAEVILIPWDMEEPYGHSDGMIRSIGKGKLIMNCYGDFDKSLGNAIRKSLMDRFDIYELSYGDKFREKSWCHLNYLEFRNVILVPIASLASDKSALQQIEELTGKKCMPILMSKIIADGGAIHCISWTMDTGIIFENKLRFGHPIFRAQCH
ncbi:MAG: agmatine deiminase family protein [Muribaculaceae bacterium]|nr:agmatine deiminase family protein [Muribaculaceae bacterium]